jgi:hypothetical protein
VKQPRARAFGYAVVAAVLSLLVLALALLEADPTMSALDYAAVTALFAGTGTAIIAITVARQLRANRRVKVVTRVRLVVGTVARSMVAGAVWLAIITAAQLLLSDEGAPSGVIALWILMTTLVQCIVGVVVAIEHLERAAQERERGLAIEGFADRARLAALRHQLDPHFLFNSLNTIAALVREDPAGAEEALAQLGRLLRHSLATDDASGTVAQEVEVVEALAQLARARFEDDVRIEVRLDRGDAELAGQALPPFLIQPLVENAIAHGMRTAAPPVHIAVCVERCEGGVAIEVCNDGRLDGDAGGSGRGSVGLANLRERLELLYPQRHALSLDEEGGRVRARLRLERAA